MASKTIEDIKNKLSIVDVVSPYVKLKKAGRYYKGLSPFTKEKTPSFFVSPDRGTYHCFSSNQGGDIFTFIEKMEGVDFKGALKILAERAGVEIVYEAPKKKDARDKLYQAVALAEQFYKEQLQGSALAKEYAKSRNITGETARDWGIGYAPDDWRQFLSYAEEKGIDVKTLLSAGLIKEADGKKGTYYDRFRNRLMFPIRDIAGRVVGFSGRTLGDDAAKYLNSPETEIYKKSELLYGLDMAKQEMRSRGYVLVVEGQMDLILAHQAGFTNTIALSGTAFTQTQMSLVMRFSKNVMLALDSDKAGISSAEKSALLALSLGCKVKVVPMPEGEDPADIIGKDPKVFTDMVKKSVHIIDFLTAHYIKSAHDTRAALALVEEHVLPLVKVIVSPIEREHFVNEVAEMLGVSNTAVSEALQNVSVTPVEVQEVKKAVEETPSVDVYMGRRRMVLSALLGAYKDHEAIETIKCTLDELGGALPVEERVYFEVEEAFGESPSTEDIETYCTECKREHVKNELASYTHKMRIAEKGGVEKDVEECAKKVQELTEILRTYS
ncbi:MAG: DNA primase [Patescibacteria group bacterium UBA2103]